MSAIEACKFCGEKNELIPCITIMIYSKKGIVWRSVISFLSFVHQIYPYELGRVLSIGRWYQLCKSSCHSGKVSLQPRCVTTCVFSTDWKRRISRRTFHIHTAIHQCASPSCDGSTKTVDCTQKDSICICKDCRPCVFFRALSSDLCHAFCNHKIDRKRF